MWLFAVRSRDVSLHSMCAAVQRRIGDTALLIVKINGEENAPPEAAQKAFPSVEEIMQKKVVPSPLNFAK